MRPRFAGADTNTARAYQPTSINDALFPGNRKYFYYTPTQERKGMAPIGMREKEGYRATGIPGIHLVTKGRDAATAHQQQQQAGQPPHQPPTHKSWATMTNDTDAILATSTSTSKAALNLMLSEYRTAAMNAAVSNGNNHEVHSHEELANNQELLSLISGASQPSHCTDFIKTCVYGPGGSSCSSVGSELFSDSYLLLSRRGYCQPVAIGADCKEEGGASSSSAGGTVRATHMAMLNPLLDPTMSCIAVNNLLPSELRIYRQAEGGSRNGSSSIALGSFEGEEGNDNGANDNDADVVGRGTHKASSSSSFLFSKSNKVFKIKPLAKPVRVEKPVRRGALVTMGGYLVPSQGGKAVGGAAGAKSTARSSGKGRPRKAGTGDDGDDLTLAEAFGGRPAVNAGDEDDFAIVDTRIPAGAKRARDGTLILPDGTEDPNARVDDGGDGADSNGDADTNSLSSFSGDDDDNDEISDGGGSDGELYL